MMRRACVWPSEKALNYGVIDKVIYKRRPVNYD